MKTEPTTFSWSDLVRDGRAEWTGVRNYAARNFMKDMAVGDEVFIYHSVEDKEIVGIARVSAAAHQDSTDKTGTWQCVDVEPLKLLIKPVTLETIKQMPEFKAMKLVTHGRLSVQPVTPMEWKAILKLSQV